jgi:dihydroorotate dehydrogenase (fumarate)
MAELNTTYLGLNLKNPVVASASPLSKKLDSVKRMEDAGIAAVVMYSLFEEQIVHESLALNYFLDRGTESFAESLTYFPDLGHYNLGGEAYVELIQKIKASVNIPIIGSLNGITPGGWVEYAKKIEQAGADALELNMYAISTDPSQTSQDLEQVYVDLVSDVRKQIRIPLAVKLSPYFTSLPNLATRLVKAGATGLVLFNRFMQPDIDIETLEVNPLAHLSTADELRLSLRWIAILHGRVEADLALTGGAHSGEDVIKACMAGANCAMIASELIAKGHGRIPEILGEMNQWMEEFEYDSINQMRGSMSQKSVPDPAAFERANYMKALQSFDNRF